MNAEAEVEAKTPRVYMVEWRDEHKIVEAMSPRQAIGMAIPEWDTQPIPSLIVTELVAAPQGTGLRAEARPNEATVYGYPTETVLSLIHEAKNQGRLL